MTFYVPIMNIKITLFITILLYAAIISQSLFYILAMSKVMKNMQVATYIETRKLLDKHLRVSLPVVYYGSLIASIALTAFCLVNSSGLLFICSIIALVCLVADLVLIVKGNIPLNKIFNSWTTTNYPSNWQQYRSKWFSFYHIRQLTNMIGFLSLLTGIIFGM